MYVGVHILMMWRQNGKPNHPHLSFPLLSRGWLGGRWRGIGPWAFAQCLLLEHYLLEQIKFLALGNSTIRLKEEVEMENVIVALVFVRKDEGEDPNPLVIGPFKKFEDVKAWEKKNKNEGISRIVYKMMLPLS